MNLTEIALIRDAPSPPYASRGLASPATPGPAARTSPEGSDGGGSVFLTPPSGSSSSSFAGMRSGLRMLVEGGERL